MKAKRIEELEQYIIEKQSASLDHLCDVFNISKVTLRRDLDELVERGNIKKVYGGVMAVDSLDAKIRGIATYDGRSVEHPDDKRLVAQLATNLIHDNDVVYIDSGTTTMYMPDYMQNKKNVTVITNSVPLLVKLMPMNNIKTIMLPGVVQSGSESTVGSDCIQYLKKWHVQKAFMACSAINEEGVFTSIPEENDIRETALKQSMRHILLVDNSKVGETSLMIYSQLNDYHIVVTNQTTEEKYQRLFAEYNIINVHSETEL